ncbi:MAG: hypothetical protein P8Y30_03330, partial [candidate division WOR-3 bacterium]
MQNLLLLLAISIPQGEFSSERFDSLNMGFVGNWPFGSSLATEVDSARTLAFCGSGGGVYVLFISDPSNPVKLSEIRTRGVVKGLFCEKSTQRLYIAAGEAGLEIWDVANPLDIQKLGSCDTPGDAEDVEVSGNYAYVADYTGGLRVIDVSTPSNPSEVGSFNTPGRALGVAVSGDYAYVAD